MGIDDGNPLISLLRECVVEIRSGEEFKGTGFFVSPNEILTCAHVVQGVDEPRVSRSGWMSPARVKARAPDFEAGSAEPFEMPDLALLTVSEVSESQPCVQLECDVPVGGDDADALHLVAFCLDAHQSGQIGLNGASVEFEALLEEGEWELFNLKGGQVVHGFSGCPALNMRTGMVCGVIDSSRSLTSDLGGYAIPMSTVAETFPGLLERNADTHESGSRWKAAVEAERVAKAKMKGEAERLPLLAPMSELRSNGDYAPSDLLKPQYGVVGLIGRSDLQAHLMRWRESEDRLSVALITGGGGFGKTRLAVEECGRAQHAGWTSGLFALDASADPDTALDRLVGWPGRLFVAIDYAETRPALVSSLILRLAGRASGPQVRLVLVCRQAQTRTELEELFAVGDGRETISQVLGAAEAVRLNELELDRRLLFDSGVATLAKRLSHEAPSVPRHSLREPHFARPLFLLSAALLSVQDPSVDIDSMSREELLLELIDRHEVQYWDRWNEALGAGLDPEMQRRAVAIATVLTAADEKEALALAGVVPGLGDAPTERRRAVARWLSRLYSDGRLDRTPAIAPVEPDTLGEALVSREYVANPELLGITLDTASARQLPRALTVFTRAAVGNAELADLFRQALDERLPELMGRASAGDEEAIAALELAVGAVRPRIGAANTLRERPIGGVALAALGATVHRVALERFRELAEADPEEYLPELAVALNDTAVTLSGSGSSEALGVSKEAVESYRELVKEDPEEYLPGLALALNNASAVLVDLGLHKAGLEAGEEAVGYYRELMREDSARHLPSLAMALDNVSTSISNLGHDDKALVAGEEAVGYYRELAEADPEEYLPELARVLNNLSAVLAKLRRYDAGLVASEEAVELYQELAETAPEEYLPGLAMALINLGGFFANLEYDDEAMAAVEEAIAQYREVSEKNPGRHLPELAAALTNFGGLLAGLDYADEAAEAAVEAVEFYRELSAGNPERYLPELAMALGNLSSALLGQNRDDEAIHALKESVECYRGVSEKNPGRHLPELAAALTRLGRASSRLRRYEEALKASEEAIELYRGLVEAGRKEYLPELAGGLGDISALMGSLDLYEDGRRAGEEAIGRYRELAEADSGEYLPGLAMALANLGHHLEKLNRDEDAAVASDEAVALFRPLAVAKPGEHLSELVIALTNLSTVLAELGREEEGLETIEAVLAEHDSAAAQGSLELVRAKLLSRNGANEQGLGAAWMALEKAEEAGDRGGATAAQMFLVNLRNRDQAGFGEVWEQTFEDEKPDWLQGEPLDRRVGKLAMSWAFLTDRDESRAFLEAHEDDLLTDSAAEVLKGLASLGNEGSEAKFMEAVLRHARAEGIESAYDKYGSRLGAQIKQSLLEEWPDKPRKHSQAFLLEHSSELLNPGAERDLSEMILEEPENPELVVKLGLLTLARVAGPERAYLLLRNSRPAADDASSLQSKEDPWVLGLSRLHAGLHPQDADCRFRHALAAAAAGEAAEAGEAIERCGQLLQPWERPDYLRRLHLLAEEQAAFGDEISQLEQALASRPAGPSAA